MPAGSGSFRRFPRVPVACGQRGGNSSPLIRPGPGISGVGPKQPRPRWSEGRCMYRSYRFLAERGFMGGL